MDKISKKEVIVAFFTTFFMVLGMSIGCALLLTYPVMWLWNWLMPMIFGLQTLTFWQTFGLAMLANMIFGKINYHK